MLGDKQKIDHSAGNFAVGQNITQIYVQAPADMLGHTRTLPEVPTYDLKLAMVDDEPDISRLLRWNYRLVPKLYGRDKEVADIIRWAESDDPQILLRLVEGEGGSGKTRLAAEAALALKGRGWNAGFMASTGPLLHPAGESGLLLILDYPEEQRERVDALVKSIRARTSPGYRLRILLLSRRSFERWTELNSIPDLIGRQPIARLGPLSQDDARKLVVEASNRLSATLGQGAVDNFDGLDDWLAKNEDNRLSLYATAAAVHHVLSKDQTFALRRNDIVQDLVRREQARVDKVSEKEGLGRHALSRLLALAPIAGGLTTQAMQRLSTPEMQIVDCPENQILNRLRDLPWWDRDKNALPALTPDVLAALFTSHVLKQTPDMAPRWLWAVLQDGIGDDFAARVGRVIYDIDLIERRPSDLPAWLEKILHIDVSMASVFWLITSDDRLPHRLAGLAATAGTIAGERFEDGEHLASILNNASVNLSNAGRDDEALTTAARSVDIYERLAQADPARFEPDLAAGLNNLANRLSNAGRNNEALTAAARATDIYERLAQADPARFEPDLALSLNNLANRLRDAGRNDEALAAAARAVDIRERLAHADPARFEPNLAASLNNLANRLSEAGRDDEALTAAARAIDIRERLAQADPARFEPDLASSLNNLANRLSDVGRDDEALAATARAIDIRERLAQANPARFEPHLALSLSNLAKCLRDVGRGDEAFAAAARAVDIYERLVQTNPARFETDLAMSLTNLASSLSDAGRKDEALAAAARAIDICQRLAEANPARFEPDLALGLMAGAIVAERSRDIALACKCAGRALPMWRRLARASPAAHLRRLLQVLGDCARIFAAGGMRAEADAAEAELAQWKQAIEQAQARANNQDASEPGSPSPNTP